MKRHFLCKILLLSFLIHLHAYGEEPNLQVENVRVSDLSYTRVVLAWDAPAGSESVSSYKIYRDGEYLTTVSNTAYADNSVVKGASHVYRIAAVSQNGDEMELSAPVTVKTFEVFNFNDRDAVEQTELEDGSKVPGDTTAALMTGCFSLQEVLADLPGTPFGNADALDPAAAQFIQEEQAYSASVQDGSIGEAGLAGAESAIGTTATGNVYVNNQILELARRYQNTGDNEKALILYELALDSLGIYEGSTAYILDRIASIQKSGLTQNSTFLQTQAALANARTTYLRFFNTYFPDSTSNMAEFIHRSIASMYFRKFPVLLSYENYSLTDFNNAKAAAAALTGIKASPANMKLESMILAWELKEFDLASRQDAEHSLDGTVTVKNISAENGLAYLFPGTPYTDERSFTIQDGSCVIPVYAGHLYSFSFSLPISGGDALQYQISPVAWQSGVKQTFDYRNAGIAGNCPAGTSMIELAIPKPNYPYNLSAVKDVDVFHLTWSYVPPAGGSLDHFKVFCGDSVIRTVRDPQALSIPLQNSSAVYTYKVVAYDASGMPSQASSTLEVLPGDMTVYSDYYAWNLEHFGDQTVYATDDPDQDGMDNYREFLFGSDPTLPFADDMSLERATMGQIKLILPDADESSIIYGIMRNDTRLADQQSTSFTDTQLLPGGSYTYRVKIFASDGTPLTDWSKGLTVKTQSPTLPQADIAAYKTITDSFINTVPENYTGASLQSAVQSAVASATGIAADLGNTDAEKLESITEKELAAINAFRAEHSAPMTSEELTLLNALISHYFGNVSYDDVYLYMKLLDLGDQYYTDYLEDTSKTENLDKAVALYEIALGFRPATEEALFTALRRLGDFKLAEYPAALNDTERIAVLESYRDTVLVFATAYPDSESYMMKLLYGLIVNANFKHFPELLKYSNYHTDFFNHTLDAAEQGIMMAPDKYIYILRKNQISAWKLGTLTVSAPVPEGSTRCPGTLIIRNVSAEENPSVIPIGSVFVDNREFDLNGSSLTVPVYEGHQYEVSAVFAVPGGNPLVYNLGKVTFKPGEKMVYTPEGNTVIDLDSQDASSELSFSAAVPSVPYNLSAELRENDTFDLSWDWTPAGAFIADHFEVYQGSEEVASVQGTEASGLSRAYREDNEYTFKVRAVSADGTSSEFSGAITVTPSDDNELYQYHLWSLEHFGELVPQDGDPDNDGLSNYQEFRLGSDPNTAPISDSGVKINGAVNGYCARYYDGVFTDIPDFSSLTPYQTSVLTNFSTTPGNILSSGRGESFAASFSGYFIAEVSGVYRFYLEANDVARLYIDGHLVEESRTNQTTINRTTEIDHYLLAGTHTIYIEYLQTAGYGSLNLAWSGPDFQKCDMDQTQVWHLNQEDIGLNEIIEWQKDSDFDGVRDLLEIQHGTDPLNPDSDGDGLSDYEELYVYQTNPLLADSDGDGVSDEEEVKYILSNPLTADFNGNNALLSSINGSEASATTGTWERNGDSLRCAIHTGSAAYSMQIPSEGTYAVKFNAREGRYLENGEESTSRFTIKCYVNGTYVMTRTLETVNNIQNSMLFYLPQLPAGNADIKFVWNNVEENTFLQIDSVQLMSLGGPDTNANGVADWIDNRLEKLSELNIPSESKTSPLCFEGNRNAAGNLSISIKGKLGSSEKLPWLNGMDVIWLDSGLSDAETDSYTPYIPSARTALESTYYADVPLYQDGNTQITVSAADGSSSTQEVEWVRTNILEETAITIRKGDALKLAAFTDGSVQGSATISVEGMTAEISESEFVVHTFNNAGTFSVSAEFVPSDGSAATSNVLAITVVSGEFSGSPYVMLGFESNWLNPNLPASVYLDYDPEITLFRTAADPGSRIVFYGKEIGEKHILARLQEDGPILDSTTLDVIDCRTHHEEGYYKLLETFSDGSKLVEGKIIMSDIPADLRIILSISTAGTTFLDGSVIKELTAADFDENGVCRFQLLKAPDSPSSTCHNMDFYQGDNKLFSYQR